MPLQEPCAAAADGEGGASGDRPGSTAPRTVYFLFLGMGLATLLPWNLFISASEFFRYQFSGSPQQHLFQNWFSVVYMVTNLASNGYAMLTVTRTSPHSRILGALAANTLAYIVGVAMPFMHGARGSASFYIALAQLAVTAASSGMLVNSLFALVVHFPASHSEGLLSGQAVAGVIATAAQLLTAYSVSPAVDAAPALRPHGGLVARTVAYFAFATAVNLLLTVAFWRVSRDPYFRLQIKQAGRPRERPRGPDTETAGLVSPPAAAAATTASPLASDVAAFANTFRQVSGYAYELVLTFALTLSVFPSVTALVTSTSGFRLLTEWHFFIYNVGDLLGRRLAPSVRTTRVSSLVLAGLLRILLIPAFFACHLSYSVWYNAIQSDWVFLALVALLAMSNGYLSTSCAMAAPGLSTHPTIAGTIVGISISSGLALGSLLSWPVRSAGCLCLPF
ncbi:hypothetical protein LPJ61_000039 [Coemansia biformis]|uniref:Equilibrative nucleoside transporter 1 n=1 Tax=Coemansia biformis TaxID=1286918 RepID=A0A9W7YIJ0_9FUNG|nr:hypothetical protein LPJ61_000039 [Coemansia biformis]